TGDIVLAAITSCTNTSNPSVMLTAGLVAKNAVENDLDIPWYVKCTMTPGSKVVTSYLQHTGLLQDLEALGFFIDGYGCATCVGNSGQLQEDVSATLDKHNMTVASITSGNRNFEGRIHHHVQANYLASPPLVVAYSLAGT